MAEIPAAVELGVPTFKAFMVYDFGLDDRRLYHALAMAGASGGMLEVHCENAVMLEELTARHLEAGETAPRFHATSRPPYVEAEATARAIAYARAARAPTLRRAPLVRRGADRRACRTCGGATDLRRDLPAVPDHGRVALPAATRGGGALHHLATPPGGRRARPTLGGAGRRSRSRSSPRTTSPIGSASRSSPGASPSIASPTADRGSRRC